MANWQPLGRARHRAFAFVAILAGVIATTPIMAQQAVRSLPESVSPSQTFPVSISITVPGGTGAVGLEDHPPVGWVVSNISDSGSFDGVSMSVKWGPFFGTFPANVSYDLTAPASFGGTNCFSGTASYDGNDAAIEGDACIAPPVPATSTWGMVVLSALVCLSGTQRIRITAGIATRRLGLRSLGD